jgi:hypothetical protein
MIVRGGWNSKISFYLKSLQPNKINLYFHDFAFVWKQNHNENLKSG